MKKLQIIKSRGMAYWACRRRRWRASPVRKFSMSARWMASCMRSIADTGKPCAGFGEHGMLDINQWNTINPSIAAVEFASRPPLWATR